MRIRIRCGNALEFLALLGVWFLSAFPFLDPGSNVYGFDTLAYTGPNLETTFRAWRSFDIPMWADGMFGGVPFLGRLNSQALYPIHLPFVFMDTGDALDLLNSLHLLILGVGVLLFVRIGWKLRAPAGFVAGTIVLVAGYTSVKMMAYEQLVAIAWIPWLLLLFELVLRRPEQIRLAGPLSLVLSFFVLGSHPQTVFITVLGSLGYLSVRLGDTRAFRSIKTMVLAAVLSVATCILQLTAAYFLGKSSAMTGKRPLDILNHPSFVLQPRSSLLGILGDPFSEDPTAAVGSGEIILGVGAVAVGLAVVGLMRGRQASLTTRVVLAIGSIVGVLLAMGPNQVLFRVFYRIIPGFGLARVAGRWLLLPLIFIALLAALGIESLRHRHSKQRDTALVLLLPLATMLFIPYFNVPRNELRYWWLLGLLIPAVMAVLGDRGVRPLALLAPVLIVIVIGSLNPLLNSPATRQEFPTGIEMNVQPLLRDIVGKPGRVYAQTFDRFDNYGYLISNLRPNAQLLFGLRTIDGYDGGQWVQKRWVTSMRSLSIGSFNTDLTLRSQVRGPLEASEFARFGVRWVLVDTEVVPASGQLSGWRGPLERDGTIEFWENPEWRGNGVVYFVSDIRGPKVARQLRTAPIDNVIVETEKFDLSCSTPVEQCEREPANEIHSDGKSGVFKVDVNRPAILAIDQAWSKDWVVKVDGQPATTGPVNVNQLGVLLSPGSHSVTYEYSPRWFLPLLVLGWLGAAVAFLLSISWCRTTLSRSRSVKDPL